MNSEELYQKVVALHECGYGSRRIAKMLGVDRKRFERWIYPITKGKLCKPRPEPNLTPSRELSYIIGAYIGDGTTFHSKKQRKYHVRLSAKDKDFVEEFRRCLIKVTRRRVPLIFDKKSGVWIAQSSSKPFYLFIKGGMENFKAIIEKHPEHFIRGFADAEGSAVINKRYGYVNVILANTNLSILRYIQRLLEDRFQINSGIWKSSSKNRKKICYKLEITSQVDVARFALCINFSIKRKTEKLNAVFKILSRMLKRHDLYRKVLALHQKGLGYRRISKMLAIPRGTVESWVSRGHKPWGLLKKSAHQLLNG